MSSRGGFAAHVNGGQAAPTASGGGTAPTGGAGQRPRSRLARGLLTLAGALAATLALGALTSTAGAQGSLPPDCATSAAAWRAIGTGLPDGWGSGGNFTNRVRDGANWEETLNTNSGSGLYDNVCTTTRFGQARMARFPVFTGGLFTERIRVWTESDRNDSYLRLYAADGTLIAEDDDSGPGYNSFISLRVDGLPDRFVGEGSSNIPGTPVTWETVDGRGTSLTGNYQSLWLEVGTYGQQERYDTSVRVGIDFDHGAPWGSDLAAGIVAQLGGLPPTGIAMSGFRTKAVAESLRDYGEVAVAAQFFDDNDGNHANSGSNALDTASGAARRWFLTSPRGGVLHRRSSSLSTHATADHDGRHMGILGSTNKTMNARWEDAFRGGDSSRQGRFSATDGDYAYGMVPVFRHDYDPALAATGDPRAMNDTGRDDDGMDICVKNGTETRVISLAYLSGAVNQYKTCVPKRGLAIVPPGTSLDKDAFAGTAGGTHRDGSDRLEPVGYLVAQFDEDNHYGVWPVHFDLHGAPHPQPGSSLALAAGSGSGGTTLTVSGLQEGMDSPLHPDSDDADADWALQILIDDQTANKGVTACLDIPADLDDRSTWTTAQQADWDALDAHLTSLRIPIEVSRLRRGTVPPLAEVRNAPPPLRVGEFWVRELDPWFTGSGGSKVINLNRATSHARNEIYERHPERRAAHQLTATGFNFVSGTCYAVSVRYLEIHPGTGLPVATGLKLRLQAIAP